MMALKASTAYIPSSELNDHEKEVLGHWVQAVLILDENKGRKEEGALHPN